MKGKVLQFRGEKSATASAFGGYPLAEAQPLTVEGEEGTSGFGPDDYSFSWLVVGDRLARFDDNVFTFPSAQDGY